MSPTLIPTNCSVLSTPTILPQYSHIVGGSQGLSPTYEQAHVGLDLLTLVSYILRRIHDSCTNPAYIINQPLTLSNHMSVYSKTFILLILESELIFKVCLKIFYLNSFLLHSISISYCYSIILFRIKVICYTEWSTYLILSSVSLTYISSVIKLTVIVLRKLCLYLFCAFVKLLRKW